MYAWAMVFMKSESQVRLLFFFKFFTFKIFQLGISKKTNLRNLQQISWWDSKQILVQFRQEIHPLQAKFDNAETRFCHQLRKRCTLYQKMAGFLGGLWERQKSGWKVPSAIEDEAYLCQQMTCRRTKMAFKSNDMW